MNISDEQVQVALSAHAKEPEGSELMVAPERRVARMRAALEAYEASRVPDPRVVELVRKVEFVADECRRTAVRGGAIELRGMCIEASNLLLAAMENDK